MRILLILSSLLFFLGNISAQKISGYVIDATNKQGVPFATVTMENTNKGDMTDEKGFFEISSRKRQNPVLIISCLGYNTKTINYNSDSIIELTQKNFNIQEVTVYSRTYINDKISAKRLKNEQIKNFAGISKDAIRSIQLFPGISVNNELSAQYNVRGGTYEENSVLINGVRVHEPFHIKEEPLISVGIFNIDLVENIHFSSGGFSAKYGNALSSLLKIDYKEGSNRNFNGKLNLSLIDFGLNLNGPVNSKLTYQIGLRKDYSNYMLNMTEGNENVKLSYYDIQSQLDYIFSPKNRLKMNFIYSFDDFFLDPPRTSSSEFAEDIRINRPSSSEIITSNTTTKSFQDANMDYSSTIFSLNSYNKFSNILYNNTIFSYYSENTNEKSLYNFQRIRNYQSNHDYYDVYTKNKDRDKDSKTAYYTAKTDFTFQLAENNAILFGAQYKKIIYNVNNTINNNKIWENNITNYPDTISLPYEQINDTVDTRFSSYKIGGYLEDNIHLNDNLFFKLGSRFDYFEKNKSLSISPRISFSYLLPIDLKIKSAWGIFHQTPTYKQFKNSISSKDNTNNQKVIQYILGLEYSPRKKMKIKLEGYYKDYKSLISSRRLYNNEIIYNPNISSVGFAKGIDFSLQKSHKWYSLWLSYGFLISKEKTEEESKYFNRYTDQRHTFSSNLTFFLKNKWQIGIKYFYGSGYSYTPYKATYSEEREMYVWEELEKNSAHYPAYSRLDLRVSKKTKLLKKPLNIYLDILNLLNKENVVSYFFLYDRNGNPIKESNNLLPFIPSVGLSYSF